MFMWLAKWHCLKRPSVFTVGLGNSNSTMSTWAFVSVFRVKGRERRTDSPLLPSRPQFAFPHQPLFNASFRVLTSGVSRKVGRGGGGGIAYPVGFSSSCNLFFFHPKQGGVKGGGRGERPLATDYF